MTETLRSFHWRHGDSHAEFTTADLPLVIGTSASADIRVSGPGGQTLAQIDLVDGRPILQPLLRPSPFTLDGAPLAGSTTVSDGQQLEVYGATIRVSVAEHRLTLEQDAATGRFETVPPEISTVDDDAPIEAATWQPAAATTPARNRSTGVWVSIGVGLALLAGVAIWFATAVPVRLETTPALPDAVAFDGPGFPVEVGERFLLRPGVHTVRLESAGYFPLQQRVEVTSGTTALVLEQSPLPGTLTVTTPIEGAEVTLSPAEGEPFNAPVPARFEGLLPGDYDLTVTAEGYLQWQDAVAITGLGRDQSLAVDLVADAATVRVQTTPPGASVFLVSEADNSTLAEATPAAISIPTGQRTVLFQLDGYKPVERTYDVVANADATAEPIVFEPADAVLRVTSTPAGASITINGRYRGVTPATVALDPGRRYEVALARSGYAGTTRRLTLRAAERRTLRVDLSARLGTLNIRTVPADATILINGREVGSGTLSVDLPAEPQSIEVRKEGYQAWRTTVTPRAGLTQTVDAELLTMEQARLAAIKQVIEAPNGHTMRYVTGGTFQQGTSRREPDRRTDEALRDVRITRPFYVATHETSNAQFGEFRRDHDRGGRVYASLAGDRNPVVNVSWQEAAAYCNWLSEKEGRGFAYVGKFGELVPAPEPTNGYRLPTEAEWVWIARYGGQAGSPRRFGWGRSLPPPDKVASLADIAADALLDNILLDYNDGFPATSPVGSFRPNRLGLYDLDGNVREWVQDYYAISPPNGPLIDPRGPASGSSHVIRGAGWRDANAAQLRLAARLSGKDAAIDVGFRVVRPAEQ